MKIFTKEFFISLIIVAIFIVTWLIVKNINKKILKEKNKNAAVKLNYLFSVISYIWFALCLMLILQIYGINVSALFAGLGVASVVVAFALQDFLKDTIAGLNIAWFDLFKIGDVVKYGDYEGEVVFFSSRVTKIVDINTNNVIVISNRNITDIEIESNLLLVDLPASYNDDPKKIRNIMEEISTEAKKLKNVNDCRFAATSSFEDSYINYRLVLDVVPKYRYQCQRDLFALTQDIYKKHKISIPFSQLDVHLDKK